MSAATYAYSNTRIRVMKGDLLTERQMDALVRSKDLEEFVSSLRQTYYADVLASLEKTDVQEIEEKLGEDFVRTVDVLHTICPENCKPLFEALLKRYELELVKFIINSKGASPFSGIPFKKPKVPFEDVSLQEFASKLESASLGDVVSLLEKRYEGIEFKSDETDPAAEVSSLDVLVALDNYYFSNFLKSLDSFGVFDKKIAKKMVCLEVEAANILIILRSAVHGFNAQKYLIRGSDYNLKDIEEYFKEDVSDIFAALLETPYAAILKDAFESYEKTKSLLPVEVALKKYIASEGKRYMGDEPLKLTYIFGYLKMKEIEIDNLKVICLGISEGLSAEKIDTILVMPE